MESILATSTKGHGRGQAKLLNLIELLPNCLMYYLGDFLDTKTTFGLSVAFEQIKAGAGGDDKSRLGYSCQTLSAILENKINELTVGDAMSMVRDMAYYSQYDLQAINFKYFNTIVRQTMYLVPDMLRDWTSQFNIPGRIRLAKQSDIMYASIRQNPLFTMMLQGVVGSYVQSGPMSYPVGQTKMYADRGGAIKMCSTRLEWFFIHFIAGEDGVPMTAGSHHGLQFINMCSDAYINKPILSRLELILTLVKLVNYTCIESRHMWHYKVPHKKQIATDKCNLGKEVVLWLYDFIFKGERDNFLLTDKWATTAASNGLSHWDAMNVTRFITREQAKRNALLDARQ
jgi:hypothetical protein